MRTLGYVVLDSTEGGTSWLRPEYSEIDRSALPTALLPTLRPSTGSTTSTAQTSVPDGPQPRGYQGFRRQVDWHARLSTLAVGVGACLVWCSIVILGALAVYALVLPHIFGR